MSRTCPAPLRCPHPLWPCYCPRCALPIGSRRALRRGLKPHDVTVEIGIGLTGFGFVLTFLGVLFFFDKGLLAMGNVCCSLAYAGCML